jgi:hypothetical protein
VRLIVLHTAEGATTIESLGNFFANPSSGVSSHTGADDKPGKIGEYVRRPDKAWTAANANPVAVQIELCAFAAWTTSTWNQHPNMLDNCARWIAEEAAHFGLPITKLTPAQAQGSGRGVCQHKDLGSWGGGHHDCGSGFPYDRVLDMARSYLSGGDEMGFPDWYYQWRAWYYNTDRNPNERPSSAPESIPQWAWDAGDKDVKFANNRGMTQGERDWVDWYNGGKRGTRPDVPQTIPDRWWDDQLYVARKG